MPFESLRTVLDEHPVPAGPALAVTATVSAAIALMNERSVDAVVAVDDGRYAGLLTARDVLCRFVGTALDVATTRIGDALSAGPPSVDIDTTADQTLDIMKEHGCHHVAVSARGRVLGVLSKNDLSAWIIRNQQEQIDCAIRAVKRLGYSNRRG